MHKFIVPIVATLVFAGPVRAEQTLVVAPVPPDHTSPCPDAAAQPKSVTQQLEDAVREQLARVGLTGIQIVPMSVLVRAKDADGNSVAFVLSPNAVAESDEAPDGTPPDAATPPVPGEQKF